MAGPPPPHAFAMRPAYAVMAPIILTGRGGLSIEIRNARMEDMTEFFHLDVIRHTCGGGAVAQNEQCRRGTKVHAVRSDVV